MYLANNEPMHCLGVGNMHIKVKNGMMTKLTSWRFGPSSRNLILVGKLVYARFLVIFKDVSWRVTIALVPKMFHVLW